MKQNKISHNIAFFMKTKTKVLSQSDDENCRIIIISQNVNVNWDKLNNNNAAIMLMTLKSKAINFLVLFFSIAIFFSFGFI